MKRSKFYLVMAFALASGTINTGCEEIKKALFVAFSAKSASVDFTIPMVTDTTNQMDLGTIDNTINLDSIIKAETKDEFSMADIKKISVEEARIIILNPDVDNNLANFENGKLLFHTDVKPLPVEINSGLHDDVYGEDWILPPVPDVNLKDYLSGSQLHYVLNGKARRATTKDLQCRLEVKFRVE